MREKKLKLRMVLGIISILGIIANILLRFAFRIYGELTFWIIIIIFAIIAWPVMNWLKK